MQPKFQDQGQKWEKSRGKKLRGSTIGSKQVLKECLSCQRQPLRPFPMFPLSKQPPLRASAHFWCSFSVGEMTSLPSAEGGCHRWESWLGGSTGLSRLLHLWGISEKRARQAEPWALLPTLSPEPSMPQGSCAGLNPCGPLASQQAASVRESLHTSK